MNSSKLNSVTQLLILVFSIGLLLSSCKERNIDYSSEIKEHFGDMLYTTVTLTDSKLSDLKPFPGEGIIRDSLGKAINIKWFALSTESGEIGGFSIGPRKEKAPEAVALTDDQTHDRLNACETKEGEELRKCLDDVWQDLIEHCLIYGNDEHCWIFKR